MAARTGGMHLRIVGQNELRVLAARLTVAGGPGMRRAVRLAMREACRPALSEIRQEMLAEEMPAVSVQTVGLASNKTREVTGGGGGHGGGSAARLNTALGKLKHPSESSARRAAGRSGLRQTIASGVGVAVGLSPKVPSVRIRVSNARLPTEQKGLPVAIEKGAWRHPVFGRPNVWVNQESQPFFYPPIRRHLPQIEAEVMAVARLYVQRMI